jgi:hypothetical protein
LVGSIAANLHEGSRSEYLAQFVFSSFGTAIPVPHQEDTGLDIYCTLLERNGRRAWPRAYYAVQVKSTMEPWVFGSAESVRWIIEHPLPMFLCIVQKSDARLLIYHPSPRFTVWASPKNPSRLELIPGTATKARTSSWINGEQFKLDAPILNFTVQEVLDRDFRAHAADVLKYWIDYDVDNLFRIKSGIHHIHLPYDYETNTTNFSVWVSQGVSFREESLSRAEGHLQELLRHFATHHFGRNEMVRAAIYSVVLRKLCPVYKPGTLDPHDTNLHMELNRCFGMDPPTYLYQAADSLLKLIEAGLSRHGIVEPPSSTPAAGRDLTSPAVPESP